jgi:hypothetical protein
MASKTVTFDDLDRKVIQELPLLLDVLAATGNKIARSLDPYYDELQKVLKEAAKGKAHWKLERARKSVLYPLTDVDYSNTTKIERLQNHFEVLSEFFYSKKVGNKLKNYFFVEAGYHYESEAPAFTGYYFRIAKYNSSETYGGVMRPRSFYELIKKKNPAYHMEIEHPDDDGDEAIELYCHDLDPEKLAATFEFFKSHILTPFLKGMRW